MDRVSLTNTAEIPSVSQWVLPVHSFGSSPGSEPVKASRGKYDAATGRNLLSVSVPRERWRVVCDARLDAGAPLRHGRL